jgi:hypothetical protein
MTMANEDKWTIQNNSTSPALGNALNTLRVKKTSGGGYELYQVVAKTTDTSPPFTFYNFSYGGQTWNMTFQNLPVSQNGGGTWQNPGSNPPLEGDLGPGGDTTDGDFTAQASGGPMEAEDDAASSAGA